MLRKIKSHLAVLLMLALAFTLLIPAPVQAASKKKPVKVTVTSVKTSGTNKVVVKWRKAKYATNYRIYWRQAGTKKWRTLATVKSNKTTYTHKSNNKARLVAGKKYVYTVRAYNKYGKKWGSYNPKGKTVMIPKKKVAPPATSPVKPKPTTQAPAKPTATPVPAKPTEAPRPTATPVPAKPTEAPKPTATPAPVKVSSVTINPSTIKLTSKGQTAQLSVSVLPSNADNKSVTWSSSNTNVVTVSNDGTVTAVANGNATITATAADRAEKSGSCSVTVEIQNESSQVITLEGGKGKQIGITPEEIDASINIKDITFEITNPSIIKINGIGYDEETWCNVITFTAIKKGSTVISAKYNNNILRRWTINIASDWTEYLAYANWRKQIENQIWTASMSQKEKMKATESYIKNHYGYENGSSDAVKVYLDKTIDCHAATEMMGDFAKDINLQVKYVNAVTGNIYDYKVKATSEGGHTYNLIFVDNSWEKFDATPIP